MAEPKDMVPVPDPTVLTTQALKREIAMSRDVIETRLAGMDKAIELLRSTTDKFPDYMAAVVARLQELHEEKFRSIQVQFSERDTRSEQSSKDSKVAVDAALTAQKEAGAEQNKSNALANTKMETAFMKQIDQLGVLIASATKTSDEKIDDIKSRIGAIESTGKGMEKMWGWVMAALMAAFAVTSFIYSGQESIRKWLRCRQVRSPFT